MSLFQCEKCGCCENTAMAPHTKYLPELYDWRGYEDLKGLELCSACGPCHFSDGTRAKDYGKWHGVFPRVFLPKGKFNTNQEGNLAHIDTGVTDFRQYKLDSEEK